MTLALVLLACGTLGGTLATWWFAPRLAGYARVAWGTVIGWTLLAFGGYAGAALLGMGAPALFAAALAGLLPASLLAERRFRDRLRGDLAAARSAVGTWPRRLLATDASSRGAIRSGAVVTALWVLLMVAGLWLVAARTLFETAEGALAIGNVNNLGDLPYHTSIATGFAWGDNYPPQNPVLAGSDLSYYFISDFLVALPLAAGASLVQASFLVTLGLLLALVAIIHRWAREVTGTALAARLVTIIALASGGMGWLQLLSPQPGQQAGLAGYIAGDARYTIGDPDGLYRFGNVVTVLLIPQRGFLLGLGLAVIVLTLLWRQVDIRLEEGRRAGRGVLGTLRSIPGWQRMLAAGVLTGALPLVHTYVWAVTFGTAFLLGMVFRQWQAGRWRAWTLYVVPTLLLSIPALAWETRGRAGGITSFLAFQPGWDAGSHNLISFWAANAGPFIVLLLVACLAHFAGDRRSPFDAKLIRYASVFLVWFLLPNVLRLAPWIWDNIKVIYFWWLGSAPLVAILLERLWRDRGLTGRLLSTALAAAVVTAGLLDIGRIIIGPRSYVEWDGDAVSFAQQVRTRTPAGSTILTAPTYNSPIFLSGRPVLLGYTGWLFGNGLSYEQREQDVRTMYGGGATAEDLLRANGVDYVVVGPQERAELNPDATFLGRLPIVAEVGRYRLLQVPR